MAHLLRAAPVVLLATAVLAAEDPPFACQPAENPVVCSLKVERNNAMDELAVSDGNARRDRDAASARAVALAAYWAKWVEGDIAKADWWASYLRGLERGHGRGY